MYVLALTSKSSTVRDGRHAAVAASGRHPVSSTCIAFLRSAKSSKLKAGLLFPVSNIHMHHLPRVSAKSSKRKAKRNNSVGLTRRGRRDAQDTDPRAGKDKNSHDP